MAIASTIRTLRTKIAPRLDSLQARLIATAMVWTVLGLVVGGFVLSNAFRASVESDFDARMKFDLDGLVAAAEPGPSGQVSLAGHFTDPRFERVYSGWYWQIAPEGKGEGPPQISRSLFDHTITVTDSVTRDGVQWSHGIGPEDQHLRIVSRHVEFPVANTPSPTDSRSYRFLVAGNSAQIEAEVARFNSTLLWSFAVLGAALILAILIQVRIALIPLRRLRIALARIRDGRARKLDGKFPAEIAPLAVELNALIAHNAEVVARARTHVSNLAHFLKTPLTVIASEAAANPGPLADAVTKQTTTMRRQVDHYLARARAAGAVSALGNRTEVAPVIDDLARVLRRIHAERGIAIAVKDSSAPCFKGERQDLEEMAGNLMDNACKWARSQVSVAAGRAANGTLEIVIGDDGPGLSLEEVAQVGERGERLDESVPGTGLGLAIVRDIAKLYGGSLALGRSSLGGLEARLVLPAIV
ncbi:MAG TPA: sensor histidine kinase [Rhizomicrobium sp.]|nr:sensor histidine kinase [Rhizomicrobium sp.]